MVGKPSDKALLKRLRKDKKNWFKVKKMYQDTFKKWPDGIWLPI